MDKIVDLFKAFKLEPQWSLDPRILIGIKKRAKVFDRINGELFLQNPNLNKTDQILALIREKGDDGASIEDMGIVLNINIVYALKLLQSLIKKKLVYVDQDTGSYKLSDVGMKYANKKVSKFVDIH